MSESNNPAAKKKAATTPKTVIVDNMLSVEIAQTKASLHLAVSGHRGTRHNLRRKLEALQKKAE